LTTRVAASGRLRDAAARGDYGPGTAPPSARAFVDYFRCPEIAADVDANGALSTDDGYFTFAGTVCYGRCAGAVPARHADGRLPDVSNLISSDNGRLGLPFSFSDVVRNLRMERYRQGSLHYMNRMTAGAFAHGIYYGLRPILPVSVRKHLQKIRLAGWEKIAFPHWPVDVSVDTLMRHVMARVLEVRGQRRIPFVWFWPAGARAGAIVTHDVESAAGRDFCGNLMDLDQSFGIKSAFQVVPEGPAGEASRELVGLIRGRGFEVNVHDLNHDGYLFENRERFLTRAAQINRYARLFDSRGFRSGAMYRDQEWYDAFDFSYDMSVPNVAHLEPQRGGCCTVMPYFVGNILELPLTTTQDYSLFHILVDYSTTLWKRQIELILSQNGLISFLTHPDYLIEGRARAVYAELLKHLGSLRNRGDVWLALPADVDRWWRNRQQMRVVPDGDGWRVEGPDRDRARVAYASLEEGRVVYTLDERS
jgi:hypothetical protein